MMAWERALVRSYRQSQPSDRLRSETGSYRMVGAAGPAHGAPARNIERMPEHGRPRSGLQGLPTVSRARPVGIGVAWSGRLKRRTMRQLRSKVGGSAHHHSVYVVLLRPGVRKLRQVQRENPLHDPAMPCVYVGMTGLTPEERFENHKKGIKAAGVVKRYGVKLLPELYAHLNPMPFEAAVQMEQDLAEDLRRLRYTVTGGH